MYINNYFHLIYSLYKYDVYFKEEAANSRQLTILDELKSYIQPLIIDKEKPLDNDLDKTFPDNITQIQIIIKNTFKDLKIREKVLELFTELSESINPYQIYNLNLNFDNFIYFCDTVPKDKTEKQHLNDTEEGVIRITNLKSYLEKIDLLKLTVIDINNK